MSSRIALITGANKGIGLETAKQLAEQGITVLLGSRDTARGEAAAASLKSSGLDVKPIQIDVTDQASIDRAAKQIESDYGHLDILINNAGVNMGEYGVATTEVTMDTWTSTFDTNVYGVLRTTKAMLPLLKKSDSGRIVNLSSILGSNEYHATPGSPVYDFKVPAYNVSKTTLNAITVHMAYDLKDTKIKVNAAHPGWVKTEMGGEGATMELPDGAKTSIWLATLPDDGPTGGYFHLGERLPW